MKRSNGGSAEAVCPACRGTGFRTVRSLQASYLRIVLLDLRVERFCQGGRCDFAILHGRASGIDCE